MPIMPTHSTETEEIIHILTATIMVTPNQARKAANLIQQQQEDINTLITAITYGCPPKTLQPDQKTAFNNRIIQIIKRHTNHPTQQETRNTTIHENKGQNNHDC